MNREEILTTAKKCVCTDRQNEYGTPRVELKPSDVAAMMALLKIARIATGHGKADNWVDLAGYAACGGELEALENKAG